MNEKLSSHQQLKDLKPLQLHKLYTLFAALPSSLSLLGTGSFSPLPFVCRRLAAMSMATNAAFTPAARFSLSKVFFHHHYCDL